MGKGYEKASPFPRMSAVLHSQMPYGFGRMEHPHGSDYRMSLLDIRLEPGGGLRHELLPQDRGFVYALAGRG